MTHVLITPLPGTSRSIGGKVMTGGHHYVLVNKQEVEVRNALTQGWVTALEGVESERYVSTANLDAMVRELSHSRIQEEGETYEDYRANLYRFALEALTSESEEVKEEPTTKATPKSTPKTTPKTAPKTAENKADENKTGE